MKQCKFCGKQVKPLGLAPHQRLCPENPLATKENHPSYGKKGTNQYIKGAKMKESTKIKISKSSTGKKHSTETRTKISESMKKAHTNGTAWNIGKSRWNNEQSYPEQFFSRVIDENFVDKNYTIEHPLSIYSFDFAWVDKKKAIEIDGAQHSRFKEYIERDLKKDKLAIENGWQVLRIKWKDMFNEPQKWIQISYDFIHKDSVAQR